MIIKENVLAKKMHSEVLKYHVCNLLLKGSKNINNADTEREGGRENVNNWWV